MRRLFDLDAPAPSRSALTMPVTTGLVRPGAALAAVEAGLFVVDFVSPSARLACDTRRECAPLNAAVRAAICDARAMFTPEWPLRTERLLLRPFEETDLDALYAIHADENNVRYLYNEVRTRDEVHALLARKRAGAAVSGEGDWLSAAAIDGASDELVADVSLLWASAIHQQGEIGFIVHPAHQGRGFATEAARPLLAFAFETLGLHRVYGRVEPRNVGSARVLEKLGMRQEAHLIENEWVKGEWQSEAIYAMLAREWTAVERA